MFENGIVSELGIGERLARGSATATAAYDIRPVTEQSMTARHSFFVVARKAMVDFLFAAVAWWPLGCRVEPARGDQPGFLDGSRTGVNIRALPAFLQD
jgi:hypothetical protein